MPLHLFDLCLLDQVQLLKEGKDIPSELQDKIAAGKARDAEQQKQAADLDSELTTLRDKVRSQSEWLARLSCKNMMFDIDTVISDSIIIHPRNYILISLCSKLLQHFLSDEDET